MYKVLRSYSKKAERKHESSRAADSSMRSGNYQHSSERGVGGGGGGSSSYYEEHRSSHGGHGGGSAMGGSTHLTGSNGQLLAIDNRHLANAYQEGRQGFSESSSYETKEHYEQKMQRVKKTRGERERSRSLRRGNEVEHFLGLEKVLFKLFLLVEFTF